REVRGTGGDLHVDSDLDAVIGAVRGQTRLAHRTVPLLMTPVAVLTLFVLWLVLAAATEQRRGEVAVARLRGRGPAGAVGLLLVELLPVLLVGVVPGAVAALLGGALARSLLPGSAPLEAGPGFAIAVLLAVAAVVLTTVASAVRVAREPLDGLLRSGRVSSRRWALGALDAFLIAAVGTGVLAFVTGSLSGTFALLGPALLALLAGLLLAHLTGPAATALGRNLLRRGRLVPGVTLLEMGRRRETRAAIVVITVASALAVFALDAFVVGDRTRANASKHDAGAPVVLRLDGRDLPGVREALSDVDPTGERATPVMVAGTTLAVEPDGFRRIAFFPRGAPTAAQWRALAPPDKQPMTLTGSRLSLTVRTGPDLRSIDAFGADSGVVLSLVVTTDVGARRTVSLGGIPPYGESAKLVGKVSECAGGCTLTAVEFRAAPGVMIEGDLEISDLRVDGRPADWSAAADDWNATDEEQRVIRPSGTATGTLHLLLSLRGLYPAELTPAWVPRTVPALLPTARQDTLDLEVTGVDGSDRTARSAGRVTLIPTMPARSALVDLDVISRGAEITPDAHAEVWLVDDPELVTAVTASLRERGILVTETRRLSAVQQTHRETVATWSLALGVVVGPIVLLLALLVLLVLAVTGWRERARDLAILRMNGAGRRTTRRLAVWAQLPAILLAVGAGVGAGVLGAALAMPDVSFFPIRPEVPVIDTAVSWPAVLCVAAACFVLLPVAAALAGRAIAHRAHLARVREAA
ncbi:MAG: FtsX-like permease family protein, partial [Nocardioides sp.]|uniref:FtsX-like permease family protein n=1 Tax=Nocardioides sp. TaxID=35761 RepID=UPI00326324E2